MESLSVKKKIVLLTDCFVDLQAGAERQIFELAKGLKKEKYSVTIASLECEGNAPRGLIESVGCRLAVFPVKRIYGVSGLKEGFRFRKFLKKEKTDILMTYHFSSDIWGTVIAKTARVPVIISNRRDIGFWRSARHIWAYKAINRCVHKVIVNANAIRKTIVQQEGLAEEKVRVIHNGVEVAAVSEQRSAFRMKEEIGVSANDLVIGHVANLRPVKGHIYLIKALAQIVPQYRHVKLLLIGEDRLNGQIQNLASTLGIKENVLFLGKRQDVRDLLDMTDICVLPSLSEGMSNAILEYMAAGKPVIATDIGGNPELIDDGVHGLLIPKEDERALAQAVLTLIKDSNKRAAMGQNGYKKVIEEFSMPKMVQNYEGFFESLLCRRKQKNILHLISSGGLFGAEQIVLSLSRSFNHNGTVAIVGALDDARHSHLEVVAKAQEEGLPASTFPSKGRFDIGTLFALKRYLKEKRIDILHTHNYKSDLIGLLAAKMAGVPVVATAHGFTDMTSAVSLYEKLDRWILKAFFNRVVVVADSVPGRFPKQKKHVISNGLDISRFIRNEAQRSEVRKRFNIRNNDIVIGTVGRLSKEKNQMAFLEAAYAVIRKNPRVRVMIVGDGPLMKELRHFVEFRHLTDKVILTGIIKDIIPVYQAMDVFVLSSLTEGVPLTILEAMASHVPVIATRVGGIPGIVQDNVTGLLVESQDTGGLRAGIDSLIKDSSKRRSLSEAAFEFVKKQYSQEKMHKNYQRIYEEVLS